MSRTFLRNALLAASVAVGMVLLVPSHSCAQDATIDDVDRQAGYCMQAEFGFAKRDTDFGTMLKQDIAKAQAALARPDLDQAEKAQMTDAVRTMAAKLSQAQADGAHHTDQLKKVVAYLTGRQLLEGSGADIVAASGEQAQKDQQAEQSIHKTCLSACTAGDAGCKFDCNTKADDSEPNKRLLSCDAFAETLPVPDVDTPSPQAPAASPVPQTPSATPAP